MKRIGKWLLGLITSALTLVLVIVLLPYAAKWIARIMPDESAAAIRASVVLSQKLEQSAKLETLHVTEEGALNYEVKAAFLGTVASINADYTYEGSFGIDLQQVTITRDGSVLTLTLPAPELLRRLRAQLPGDIGVLTLAEAGPRFHARLSCRGKTYVYRVWNSDTPNVFERRYVYALPQPLDTAVMQRAAALLCGRHDYTSFCANRHMKKSAVRTVDAITVERLGDEVRLTFSGEGFLYHMVRILTGTLLEVGLGERDAGTMADILAARDRAAAGPTAPARGLILWETRY